MLVKREGTGRRKKKKEEKKVRYRGDSLCDNSRGKELREERHKKQEYKYLPFIKEIESIEENIPIGNIERGGIGK